MPGIQVCTARRAAGSVEGFYFAAAGGHNAKSHSHNDVGNFVVFLDGAPVLVDAGVETYTAKTFSKLRYEIWTMQSGYHNLPTINGVMQHEGRQYEARDVSFHADEDGAEFRADIAAAYPAEAGLKSWRRSVRLDRWANKLSVTDRYALKGARGRVELNLMTPCNVEADGASALVLSGSQLGLASVRIAMNAKTQPQIRIEEIPIEDARLKPVWGAMLRRIVAVWEDGGASGELRLEIAKL
jgi:hypothetical protein